MEFLDEESRPRLMFQSRPSPTQSNPDSQTLNLHKPTLFISLSLSSLFFAISFAYLESEPFKSLILWLALSLLIGPFAPSSLTAGDIRVGLGPSISPPPSQNQEINNPIDTNKKSSNRRSKSRKPEELAPILAPVAVTQKAEKTVDRVGGVVVEEEKEWSEGDLELLKKQMAKYPAGMPGRWEAVAEVFGGRHGVESVIKKVKSTGDKKTGDSDSFSRFLKDRKPVDKRVDEGFVEESGELKGWSAGEDLALLNALKAFPKDVAMRWEKITAAVPGKSKAACMKRVAELKKDFRTSKASAEA